MAAFAGSLDGVSLTSRKFERSAGSSGGRLCALRVVGGFGARGRLMHFSTRPTAFLAIAFGLAMGSSGCAYENSLMAAQTETSLVGLSELELETCLGLPDKEATKGKTTLLSYNATSARTVNLFIPIVNGVGLSLAGYCRATFWLENGRVAGVTYTGDNDPLEGPNSACGGLVRACLSRRSKA